MAGFADILGWPSKYALVFPGWWRGRRQRQQPHKIVTNIVGTAAAQKRLEIKKKSDSIICPVKGLGLMFGVILVLAQVFPRYAQMHRTLLGSSAEDPLISAIRGDKNMNPQNQLPASGPRCSAPAPERKPVSPIGVSARGLPLHCKCIVCSEKVISRAAPRAPSPRPEPST